MKQSRELTLFYRAYKAWLDAGAPQGMEDIFQRHFGLCNSVVMWSIKNGVWPFNDLKSELSGQLIAEGLDEYYPFGGLSTYEREAQSMTAFMNEARISWVHAHVEG